MKDNNWLWIIAIVILAFALVQGGFLGATTTNELTETQKAEIMAPYLETIGQNNATIFNLQKSYEDLAVKYDNLNLQFKIALGAIFVFVIIKLINDRRKRR